MKKMRMLAAVLSVLVSCNWGEGSSTTHASIVGSPTAGTGPGLTDAGLPPYYGQTAWASLHRDGRNSDHAPFVSSAVNVEHWTSLDYAATVVPHSYGPEGNLYITTGKGVGFSHLHAQDRDGNVLWVSEPQSDWYDDAYGNVYSDELDAGAIGQGPVIDENGNIYVSDLDQFWCFLPVDGNGDGYGDVKWVRPLPRYDHPQDFEMGPRPFVTAIMTRDQVTGDVYVGGIDTVGRLVLFKRDGTEEELDNPIVYILPLDKGEEPGPDAGYPPGLWVCLNQETGLEELMVDEYLYALYFATLGYSISVANTPAVVPETGRIFINGAKQMDPDEALEGALLAIDIRNGEVQDPEGVPGPVFEIAFGGDSGSSPAISPDGSAVYCIDGSGHIKAVNTADGSIRWELDASGATATPSVGPDGTLYTGGHRSGDKLYAIYPEDTNGDGTGDIKWEVRMDSVARDLLRWISPFGWPKCKLFSNERVSNKNSVICVTARRIWTIQVLGYNTYSPIDEDFTVATAHKSILVALDQETGEIVPESIYELRDTCGATLSMNENGHMSISHSSVMSSIFRGMQPLLPCSLKNTLEPVGGVTALRPAAYRQLATEGAEWVGELNAGAVTRLNEGDAGRALALLAKGMRQIEATCGTLDDALASSEISSGLADDVRNEILSAEGHMQDAVLRIQGGENPSAIAAMNAAILDCGDAEALLTN